MDTLENKCEATPKPKTIKQFLTSWFFWKPFLGIILGGIAGFLYYYFVGCASGTCPITSNPYISVIWGSFFGFFLVNSPCSKGKC
jgi:hypothetical protein